MRKLLSLALASTGLVALATQAAAQQAAPPTVQTPEQTRQANAAPSNQLEEVVVTGTLIRGIAPAGNNVIGITTEQVAASGATTTNQILGTIPQVGNFFNQLPAGVSPVAGANASNPISRPNLRNLPGANTSGGAQTLVLLDGHRIVGAGTQQVAVDPDIIAPGVVQRVEALTDGGSAIYGSDALGGVLNFITQRTFDGVRTNLRYGFGESYDSVDGSITAGTTWDSGGVYGSYGYSHHNQIYGSDRDFVRQIDWNTGIPSGRNCANPNVIIGGTNYVPSGSGITPGGPNVCDLSDDLGIYPESTLHTAFARLVQDITDSIHFDVSALYGHRSIEGQGGTLGSGTLGGGNGDVTLTATNPSYRSPGGAQAGLPQRVLFNYGPLFGARSASQETDLTTWSIAPQLSIDLPADWQARALFSYGNAKTETRNATINAAAQAAAIANGTLNPYNVGATSPTVAALLRRFSEQKARNELYDYRAVFDGPLFNIPGGAVRLAVGYEHMEDNFRIQSTSPTTFAFQPTRKYTQKVDSVFGEVQIPVVSSENASSFAQELTINGSVRYDKYNDFGDTLNPKIGATLRPVQWLAIRGNWGKSFTAPSPVDQLNVFNSTVAPVPAAFLQPPPGISPGAGEVGLFVAGTASGIQPQKATNWSIGFEVDPPFAEGLRVSVSYYQIDLRGTIGRPVTSANLSSFYAGFPELFATRPSGQQVAAYLTQFAPSNVSFTLLNPTSTGQAQVSSGGQVSPVLVLLDTRGRNLGSTLLSGLDFTANYVRSTGFGSVDASLSGNYRIRQRTKSNASAPEVDDLAFDPRLTLQATLGATYGPFRAQVIWNHTAGFDLAPGAPPRAFGQTKVDAFDSINLFGRYQVPEKYVGKDMEVTLNVQNLFDEDPPVYKAAALSTPGYDTQAGHAFTIGRIIQVGVSKKF